MKAPDQPLPRTRRIITAAFALVEDIVYIGLGLLLAAIAIWLLGSSAWTFVTELFHGQLAGQIVTLLDQILLVLLIIELLYTVQVSFREHTLVPEPFLVIALIATVRKILVLTAQLQQSESSDAAFHHSMVELSLLTGMVLILVVSLIFLHRHAPTHKEPAGT